MTPSRLLPDSHVVATAAADRPASRVPTWRPGPSHRTWVAVALMVGCAVAGRGELWFAAATFLLAHLLADRRRTVLAAVPAATVLTACAVILALLAADGLGLAPLRSAWSTRGLLLLLTLAALPVLALAQRDRSSPPLALRVELIACLPAVVLMTLGGWLSQQALPSAAGWLLRGWDNGAHLLASAAIQRSGGLSYADEGYPRGLHALVAVFVGGRARGDVTPALLEDFLRTQSLVVWFLYALLTATVSLTTLRLAEARNIAPPLVTAAAFAAGLVVLSPSFFNFTMVYGFETTIALAFVLAVATLELLIGTPTPRTVVVLAAVVMAAAHAWQLGLPIACLPLLAVGVKLAARLLTTARWATAFSVGLLLCAAPPALAVLAQEGVAAVALHGELAPLPTLWLVAGLAATAWFGWIAPRPPHSRLVSAMVVSAAVTAVGSAQLAGASLDDYYPRKLLWHAALLSLPFTATLSAVLFEKFRLSTTSVPVLRLSSLPLGALGMLALLVFAVPGPYMATSGLWDAPGAPTTVLVTPTNKSAVCDLKSEYARKVTFRLLRFYRPDPTPLPPTMAPLPDCQAQPTQR